MNRDERFFQLRKTIILHDFVVKTEIINRKSTYTKIFLQEKVIVSLCAIAWHRDNYKDYKKYFSNIDFSNEEFSKLSHKDITEMLLCDIYNQVIKNHIMML